MPFRAKCSSEGLAKLLCDALALCEEQKVVRAAGFRVRAAHVEAAEGVRSDHRSGALAVEVQVADLKLSGRAIELLARTCIDGAGQAVLCIVGDGERLVKARRFNDCQD